MISAYAPESAAARAFAAASTCAGAGQRVGFAFARQFERMTREHGERLRQRYQEGASTAPTPTVRRPTSAARRQANI